MNTELIYKLANELTEEKVEGIVLSFNKEEKERYECLIRLGDSSQLACATVFIHKPSYDSTTWNLYNS